jgi:hypothetical protein
MTAFDYIGLVLSETPWWAFAVLALLIVLGVRRLKSRVRSLGTAFVVPAVFFLWSLVNVAAYSQAHSPLVASLTLFGLAATGWASTRLYSSETAALQGDGRFLFRGTPEPLITYMAIFAIRFGLEVWEGFVPAASAIAGGLAIGLSALMAGRTAERAVGLWGAKHRATA